LQDLLLIGNPIYSDLEREECRSEVLKRLPWTPEGGQQLLKLDGELVAPGEVEDAHA